MKVGGVICEYNPFHNGHRYQINEMRRRGITHIAVVMSPNVVQRGELSLYTKWYRAKQAIFGGADLVIELPAPYVLSAASTFAFGGVSLLKEIGCDVLCFGTEACASDFFALKSAMDLPDYHTKVKSLIDSGLSYPVAMDRALEKYNLTPNDILGIEYLKNCEKIAYSPEIMPIERTGTAHDSGQPQGEYASASAVREMIRGGKSPDSFLPYASDNTQPTACMDAIGNILIYQFRIMNASQIALLPEISEGLENRIIKSASTAVSYESLIASIKTKRYPMAKIKRTLLCGVLGCTDKFSHSPPPYIRILAMNTRGSEILKRTVEHTALPISASASELEKLSPHLKEWIDIEKKASDLFALSTGAPVGNPNPEYTTKPFFHL